MSGDEGSAVSAPADPSGPAPPESLGMTRLCSRRPAFRRSRLAITESRPMTLTRRRPCRSAGRGRSSGGHGAPARSAIPRSSVSRGDEESAVPPAKTRTAPVMMPPSIGERGARHPARVVGGEEQRRAGDVLRRAQALEHGPLPDVGDGPRGVGERHRRLPDERRVHGARAQQVDADLRARSRSPPGGRGRRARPWTRSRPRGWEPLERGDRSDDDDRAAAARLDRGRPNAAGRRRRRG